MPISQAECCVSVFVWERERAVCVYFMCYNLCIRNEVKRGQLWSLRGRGKDKQDYVYTAYSGVRNVGHVEWSCEKCCYASCAHFSDRNSTQCVYDVSVIVCYLNSLKVNRKSILESSLWEGEKERAPRLQTGLPDLPIPSIYPSFANKLQMLFVVVATGYCLYIYISTAAVLVFVIVMLDSMINWTVEWRHGIRKDVYNPINYVQIYINIHNRIHSAF